MKRNRKETVQLLYMKRLIYLKNLQSLDLVSALKNDRLYKKKSSPIYLGSKKKVVLDISRPKKSPLQ